MGDKMTCDTRAFHSGTLFRGTAIPETSGISFTAREAMKPGEMVCDAGLITFDMHTTWGVIPVPLAFINVQ
jgi:hypothetical protein